LRASTIVKILEKTDAFRRPKLFYNMLLVCQADAEGRGYKVEYLQNKLWQLILSECATVPIQAIIAQGYQGEKIKLELHARRVACVQLILNSWKKNEK
jgi:tRNA nucleotidyltransferase (CCA-adding enzyme)